MRFIVITWLAVFFVELADPTTAFVRASASPTASTRIKVIAGVDATDSIDHKVNESQSKSTPGDAENNEVSHQSTEVVPFCISAVHIVKYLKPAPIFEIVELFFNLIERPPAHASIV